MTDIDDSLIEWLTGGSVSEDFEYNMKRRELAKDPRINKDRFTDINSQYKDFAVYQQTDEYVNTMKAHALLSDQCDTNSESLRETLMSTYKMSIEDVNQCFRNLANSKDVDVHENTFNHTIKFRKR